MGVESSRSGLKSECVDIFHQSFLWLLRHTDEPEKGRNSCLWLQSRSLLSSFGVVLMSCRVNFHVVRSALQFSACRIYICLLVIFADQVFIDPRSSAYSFAVLCSPLWLMFVPSGRVFGPFWSENGYTLYPFWCGIAYGFRGTRESVWMYLSFQIQMSKKEREI